MTTSIYQNEFVFEKHGQSFSDYVAICIRHHKNKKSDNTERHHIHPKSMTDGVYDNRQCNVVNLEFGIHQEVHQLLLKAFPNDVGMIKAARGIAKRECMTGKYVGENSGMFGQGHKVSGENNGMFGKKHSEESLEKMRGENNGMFGQGHKVLGENNGMFGRTGENHPGFGTKRKRLTCEHCHKDVAVNNYAKYHGDKCKFRKL